MTSSVDGQGGKAQSDPTPEDIDRLAHERYVLSLAAGHVLADVEAALPFVESGFIDENLELTAEGQQRLLALLD